MLTDRDLTLISMSANKVVFTGEVNDDFYAAHRFVHSFAQGSNGTGVGYVSDEPIATLGCTQQYRVCPPTSSSEQDCIVTGGLLDISFPLISEPSGAYSIIPWVTNTFDDLIWVVKSLGPSSLTSRFGLNQGFQGPLPDDQWQSEVEYWHNISLVSLQNVVYSATGPGNPEILEYYWAPPTSREQKSLCKSQVRIFRIL